MATRTITGIHHVTAIAGDPQRNLDFYTTVLGLRLVKLTVNFDDPGTYHFYFGNDAGAPGSILTFFPWVGIRRGVIGSGQVTATTFAVTTQSAPYWERRLTDHGVAVTSVGERFGERVIAFSDPDGLPLEIVATPHADPAAAWRMGRSMASTRSADSIVRLCRRRATNKRRGCCRTSWALPLSGTKATGFATKQVVVESQQSSMSSAHPMAEWAGSVLGRCTTSPGARLMTINRRCGAPISAHSATTCLRSWIARTSVPSITGSLEACCSRSPQILRDSRLTNRRNISASG